MRFTVDRKTWLRGEGPIESRLLTSTGHMCCLGFFGRACGLKAGDILEKSEPQQVHCAAWPRWLVDDDFSKTYDCQRLMEVNDSNDLMEVVREQRIAVLFAAHGVEVEFTG